MPSFDVVSEVDFQEVRNAVDQAARELGTRFDFRGVDAGFELSDERIQLHAEEEFQLGQMLDILRDKFVKRGVDTRALDPGDIEASGKQKRQAFALKQGIDRDSAKNLDDMSLINGVAQIAPFDPASKQALLEANSLTERCELLVQLMQFFGRSDGGEEITTLQ